MKHSIQNFEYRIQKARNAQSRDDGGKKGWIFPPFRTISRHFPPFPTWIFLPGGAGSQKSEGEAGWNYVGKSADNYGKFHESSRKFAQIRPVNPRCYALLRVRPIF